MTNIDEISWFEFTSILRNVVRSLRLKYVLGIHRLRLLEDTQNARTGSAALPNYCLSLPHASRPSRIVFRINAMKWSAKSCRLCSHPLPLFWIYREIIRLILTRQVRFLYINHVMILWLQFRALISGLLHFNSQRAAGNAYHVNV